MQEFARPALVITLALSLSLAGCARATRPSEPGGLWPEIEPFESDYLRVSEIHEIYYELSGDPEGKPVFVLHGGPGGSSSPYMRRFFDPERHRMILFDQRGAGRSRPVAGLSEITTEHLVEDIQRLRSRLGVERKAILFGGSWGTTLALAYAEKYPGLVAGLLLRGVFLATREEIDHCYHGGAGLFCPESFERR